MAGAKPSTDDEGPTAALLVDFSRTARVVFSATSAEDSLANVVRLAVATIEGCDYAGIFLVDGDSVTTPAHTDPIVAEVDILQHRTGEGPCLDAIAEGVTIYADDLGDDDRWPHFGPEAAKRGMRSLLAVPLLSDGTLGALNLYARYPRAFGAIDRARGLLLAALAALAFTAARTHESEERRAANLQTALTTRELIGQAQGILMERERVTADEAFDILRRASQHLNRKLREVAQALVDTGEQPDTGPLQSS
jgi:GAF domain-containing protein